MSADLQAGRPALLARKQELLRDLWDMVCGSRPSGDGACDAFDQAERELYRELAAVEQALRNE